MRIYANICCCFKIQHEKSQRFVNIYITDILSKETLHIPGDSGYIWTSDDIPFKRDQAYSNEI